MRSRLLPHLFSPLQLGSGKIRNRIVFAAHSTNFAEGNLPSERHVNYYAQRAEGGAGLIIMEEAVVHPSDFPYERAIFGFDQRIVPWYRRLAEAVHQSGATFLAQLNHSGQQSSGIHSLRPVWAPSAVPDVLSLEVPKVMEREEIAEVISGFAQAAALAKKGGMDGVELNAGQRSLIRQFLSPLTNQRADEYGGSPDNRLRFCLEAIRAVRQQTGPQWIVGLRLCGDELAPWAGLTPEQAQEIASRIANTKAIDYIAVEMGSIYSLQMTWAPMSFPQGYAVSLAEVIRKKVDIPVCATGSIVDPLYAEEVLQEGKADLVDMTRALIADSELPLKAQRERFEDIRPCIRCHQGCLVRSLMNPLLSCIHNPQAGREGELGPPEPAVRKKRVMIIGGGPAGLETAKVAALRGHEVSLWEREKALGGQVRLAAKAPHRGGLAKIIQFLETQVYKAGVKVNLGVEVVPELVERESPDAVVVATGATPGSLAIPGREQANVIDCRQVLRGEAIAGQKVLIVDETGSYKAVGVAELLADQGKQVEIVTADTFVSRELAMTQDLIPWYQRAFSRGIVFSPHTAVKKIADKKVEVWDIFSGETRNIEGIDTIVLALYDRPAQELYFALKGKVAELYRVGDGVTPRKINQAILEGNQVGGIL